MTISIPVLISPQHPTGVIPSLARVTSVISLAPIAKIKQRVSSSAALSLSNSSSLSQKWVSQSHCSTMADAVDGGGGGGWNTILHLPITNVTRIMQKVSPEDGQIDYDAKEAVDACATEFISFITSEANDRCRADGRVTLTAVDIIWAMYTLGFYDYIGSLSLYLKKYREDAGKRSAKSGDGRVKKEGEGSEGRDQSDPSTQCDPSTRLEFEVASREHLMQSLKGIESQLHRRNTPK